MEHGSVNLHIIMIRSVVTIKNTIFWPKLRGAVALKGRLLRRTWKWRRKYTHALIHSKSPTLSSFKGSLPVFVPGSWLAWGTFIPSCASWSHVVFSVYSLFHALNFPEPPYFGEIDAFLATPLAFGILHGPSGEWRSGAIVARRCWKISIPRSFIRISYPHFIAKSGNFSQRESLPVNLPL